MYLLGATLTKLLATLAAVMTVTAGMPSFQCRCPDGRVKLFCQGNTSSPSGCCCATGDSTSPGKSCCCEAKKANAQGPKAAKKRSCCAQSHGERQQPTGSDGHRLAAKDGCCVKTVVAAPAVDSVEGTGVPVHQSGDTLVLWELAPVPPPVTSGAAAARSPPGFHATPPDLVVILCHFTC